jgi:sugar phosphate isomerase/epimerase
MKRALSVNRYLCDGTLPFPAFAAAAARAGLDAVGVTRAALAEMGTNGLSRCLRDNGLAVSSLNSAGYFAAPGDPAAESNFSLIDAAAEIGADVLCVIAGGTGADRPIALGDARKRVADGFALLHERASAADVTLGLEPIHPSGIATKGCINSIAQALEFIAPFGAARLIVDLAHSWWDPDLVPLFSGSSDRVALLQVCNVRLADGVPVGRDTLKSGALDPVALLAPLLAGAYAGKTELELFGDDLRGRDPLTVISEFPEEFAGIVPAAGA